jgi:hypothetical protein
MARITADPTSRLLTTPPGAPPETPPDARPGPSPGAPPRRHAGAGPPPGVAPHPRVTGPARHRRSRAFWAIGVAIVSVIALVAGVAIWVVLANRAPSAPTSLTATATATSVQLTWTPGDSDVTTVEPDEFVVLRDGDVVGTVPASRTSFLDENGLAPGIECDYQVIAQTGSQASEPSHVVVTTLAPSPMGLGVLESTPASVSFYWSQPPDSPLPDEYIILRDGQELGPVPGATDSYSVDGLKPGTSIDVQVIAVWGDARSAPSEPLTVSTLKWAAPLQGTWTVKFKTTETPGSGASGKVGDTWTSMWTFTPKCAGSDCNVTVTGSVATGPEYTAVPFTATLKRSGDVYTGSTKAEVTSCGSDLFAVMTEDALTLRLTGKKDADTGLWTAWTGNLKLSSPYTEAGPLSYCPAQSWTFSLAGAS